MRAFLAHISVMSNNNWSVFNPNVSSERIQEQFLGLIDKINAENF